MTESNTTEDVAATILRNLESRCVAIANLLPSDRYELQKALETAARAVKPVATSGDQVVDESRSIRDPNSPREVKVEGLAAGETAPIEDATHLDEIRERWNAATPGPWRTGSLPNIVWGPYEPPTSPNHFTAICEIIERGTGYDREFIAHSWEDVRDLLELVKRLQEENERLTRLSPYYPGSCMVCGGQPLTSGRECVCGGKGTMDEELRGLRIAALDAGEEVERLRKENAEVWDGIITFLYGLRNAGDGWPNREEVIAALRSKQEER